MIFKSVIYYIYHVIITDLFSYEHNKCEFKYINNKQQIKQFYYKTNNKLQIY